MRNPKIIYLYESFNLMLSLKIFFLKTNDKIGMTDCDNSIIFHSCVVYS